MVPVLHLVLHALGAAQPGSPAELRGWVTTPSEIPVVGAEVTLLAISRTTVTDSSGRFVLVDLPAGEHVMRVRRIGFRGQWFTASLYPGERKEVTIVLEPGTFQLPEIEVTARNAKPVEYAYTHKFDDFFRRREVGLGKFITREDIERRRPLRTADILTGVRGVRVRFREQFGRSADVVITGCSAVSVWIDGAQQYFAEFYRKPVGPNDSTAIAVGDFLERVRPSEIEMVEVYRGPSEIPAEFLSGGCAAIVIWTR
ncbi:MAG TPA: carboxypeptidase regulatory-like domain-containing protein [Gemmatimonadales bacterium]|jgi:hypothetical protein|nr:carboxypeptidase regulatory-like domain-containing protein [Gemmatimonadales bacterium]